MNMGTLNAFAGSDLMAQAQGTAVQAAREMCSGKMRQAASTMSAGTDAMATQLMGDRKGLSISGGKKLMVGAVAIFMFVIFVAYLAPIAYDIVRGAGVDTGLSENGTNISEVPGGSLFTSVVFVLLLLVLFIVAVIKALDMI